MIKPNLHAVLFIQSLVLCQIKIIHTFIVYLRGVEPQEMKSILQFTYLGQATFYQNRLNVFLVVAKSLEIKEISIHVAMNDESLNQSFVLEEIGKTDTKISGYKDELGQYQCDKCEKQISNYGNLNRHSKSAHEGIRYPCNRCKQTFTMNSDLKIHIQSIHEGVKFQCDICEIT